MLGGKYLETDVLVIGFGGAALRAALEAAAGGARVIIIGKDSIEQGGATGYAAAEVAGFNVSDGISDPGDSPEEHCRDILKAGQEMVDKRLAKILAEEALQVYQELREWGVPFQENEALQTIAIKGCFSTRPRMHIIPGHGRPVIEALRKVLLPYRPFVLEGHQVVDLIVYQDRCIGAVALSENNEPVTIRAGAVVLAAGGAGQLFSPNLYPTEITSDGYAMAYRAGASLINMEFMQSGLGIVLPGCQPFLVHAWIWKLRPRIIDHSGAEIVPKHLPDGVTLEDCYNQKEHFPFSVTDDSRFIEIAVKKESTKGKVFLDFKGVEERKLEEISLRRLWQTTKQWYAKHGCNLLDQPVEVQCVGHAVNGGVAIGPNGETDLSGLYAAGEVAGGPHGADRLGGNMLVTCQVFGRRAGAAAAEYASTNRVEKGMKRESLEKKAQALLQRYNVSLAVEQLDEMKIRLQSTMSKDYLIVKEHRSLKHCEETILLLTQMIDQAAMSGYNAGTIRACSQLRNMLETAAMMIEAAQLRTESRGSHYREDFPRRSPDFNKIIYIRRE